MWDPLINLLQGVLIGCGGLGVLVGLAMKALAGPDEGRHETSHKIIGSAATGLAIGLLAPDIYDLVFSWM